MTSEADKRELLENSRLFRDFSSDVIDAIIPLLVEQKFEKDNVICLKEDDTDSMYIVSDGQAEVTVSSSEGKVILLGLLSRGDIFGEVGLLDKEGRTANVTADTNVTLYRLDNEDFNKVRELFGVNEWMALATYICFLFRGVTSNLEETVFLDASIRIARRLLNLYKKDGDKSSNSYEADISQETLGRMAGLSREATNKALSKLEDKGLIELKYKKIAIPDISKFEQAIED